MSNTINHNILNNQQQHWNRILLSEPDKFGNNPSQSAVNALQLFKKENINNIIELGGAQGRDTIYFARNNINITVLDYSQSGINTISNKAGQLNLSDRIKAITFDTRQPLPFNDNSLAACYSHLLYSSAFTLAELKHLNNEIERILRPGGINFFTARNTDDPYFQTGIHHGENLYEIQGYIMHFLSKENIEHLINPLATVTIKEIEEGRLPKRLYEIVVKKPYSV